MHHYEKYSRAFRNIHFERRGGVVEIRLHTNGGPLKWGALEGSVHGQLGEAFRDLARDPELRALILTGTGEAFCVDMNVEELPTTVGGAEWSRLMREGRELLMGFLDIEVPVISAINGPVHIHAQLPVLADIVLAAESAEFADGAHFAHGVVPGDSVHVVWPMLLGVNRARYFLLTGQRISAREALALGVVNEVLRPERLRERAWELAADLEKKSAVVLRNTRTALTQAIKQRMFAELGHGLALEGLAILGSQVP